MSSSNLHPVPLLAYSVPDACLALGLSKQTVYDLLNSGKLRSYTEGKRRFISLKSLEDYIAAREAESATTGFVPHPIPSLDKHRAQQATA